MTHAPPQGYGVSVVVVDRAGDTIVALRGDKAGPHTMENARRKAYTARTFRTADQRLREALSLTTTRWCASR